MPLCGQSAISRLLLVQLGLDDGAGSPALKPRGCGHLRLYLAVSFWLESVLRAALGLASILLLLGVLACLAALLVFISSQETRGFILLE